jgi:hypothetical protein
MGRKTMTEVVDVISLAHFSDTRIGAVSRKQRLRLPIQLAEEMEMLGLVAPVNPKPTTAKETQSTEALGGGGGELSQLSPVDQALPKPIALLSSDKDGAPSLSTTATAERPSLRSSMLATETGGESTPSESKPISKASAGRKTKARQKNTD